MLLNYIGHPGGSISLEYCLILWRNNYCTCCFSESQWCTWI